ncbi:MAG: serine/threonine-protein kinase [Pirellulaceae bacterium]
MTTLHLTAAGATQAWDDLAERLERFIAAWDDGGEPTLTDFLPAEPPSHRRFVLVELIKVDLERRTAKGTPKRLEEYAGEYPELLEDGEPPCDLIYEEFHIRRGAGHDVSLFDYCRRFPGSAAALQRLLGTENASVSSQMFSPTRHIEGIAPGQKIDDFELLAELGKGAFACVYLARQTSMHRLVALKVSADKGNEPQTLATLDHPNIIRVYDQRLLAARRVRLLYMQFAPGGTLADVVRAVQATSPLERSGAILIRAVGEAAERAGQMVAEDSPWRQRVAAATWPETVCRLGVQLAQALDHAHAQGILHRDVKPANVLLSADGAPKLADFNISFSSQIEGATPAAYFGGSVAYMSPEQLDACNPNHERTPADLDGRSDLYALAVLLWELLHGERPFYDDEVSRTWAETLTGMTKLRRTQPPESPPGARDPVAKRLEQVLRKALAFAPQDRHPEGASLAREILLCLNPHAWDLVNDLGTGWRDWARRWPILALFPINLPPFVLTSVYNYWYNRKEFIENQPDLSRAAKEQLTMAFESLLLPVNGVLFALGIFFILRYAWPLARAIRCLAQRQECSADLLHRARLRSLSLGHRVAWVGLALWIAAGVAFPVGIHLQMGDFPVRGYVHFFLSMFTCGLMSCCLPFLATTWLNVRVYFPSLLVSSAPTANEHRRLARLARDAYVCLAGTIIVAFLAILLLVVSSGQSRVWSILLIVASGVGYLAAQVMYNLIRRDLAALAIATRPTTTWGAATDSIEAF